MKAAVFRGVGKPLVIESVPDPTPGPNDLVIKVHRCGICGTDLHMTSEHFFQIPSGTVIGHEYTGEVVALGKGVERFKIGDRVSGMAATGCGACEACFKGLGLLCTQRDGNMGGFGEYLRMPAGAAAKLPQTFSTADGALVEPLAIGLHGVRMADMPMGAKVLVLGAGSVGLAAIFWAKRLGAARVVAASRSLTRKPMALAMGADDFVRTGEGEVERVVEKLGGAPEIVFECAGAVGLLGQAINHVKLFGQVVSLGFCTSPDPVIPGIAAFKQVRISFPLAYTPGEFQYVADVMLAGTVDPKMMITSTVTLDELPATLELLRGPNTQTKVQVILAGP
jgi:(R,R)-butanediol dehydrogenase/meso-butanediol dehydrogenase/diacetyl reductase